MTTNVANIAEKIRALLSKTVDRGATPEEAASAAAKAQELLTKYNLDMSHVELAAEQTKRNEYGKFDFKHGYAKEDAKWVSTIMGSVAKFNFCQAIVGYGGTYYFVGKSYNVEVAQYIFTYLVNEVLRIRKEAWTHTGQYECKATSRPMWRRHFGLGAASAIHYTLKAQYERSQQTNDVRALIVVSDKELKEATARYFPVLRSGKSTSIRSRTGYDTGVREGSKIQVHAGINGASRTPQTRLAAPLG